VGQFGGTFSRNIGVSIKFTISSIFHLRLTMPAVPVEHIDRRWSFSRIPRDFNERSPEVQEAVLCNLCCQSCGKYMYYSVREVLEFEEDGEIVFEARCPRCGQWCKLRERDIP
jgi:hypothetical protein